MIVCDSVKENEKKFSKLLLIPRKQISYSHVKHDDIGKRMLILRK
jgi:hypothetical protein